MDKRAIELFGHYPEHFLKRFKNWISENPDVYDEFKRNALQMRSIGRKKYSASNIVGKIRWDRDIRTTGDVFKINNDFSPLLARLLIYHEPSFDGFFELRINPNVQYSGSHEQRERENG